MNVLITGAHGNVGTAITDHLGESDEYEFTLLDIQEKDSPHETVVGDITDYESIRPHFEDQDVVIHLALIRHPDGTAGQILGGETSDREEIYVGWQDIHRNNLKGIHNVYQAAVDAELDKIVFASSHHAVGMVEIRDSPDIYYDNDIKVDETIPHRPDSLYGVGKAYGEDLGRLVAEAHDIQFYALRPGSVRSAEYDHPYGTAERAVDNGDFERGSDQYQERVARFKCVWQSRRDLAQLVDCCMQDDSVEWDHFYGVSANATRWLDDLDHARETIGYEPKDNSARWNSPPE